MKSIEPLRKGFFRVVNDVVFSLGRVSTLPLGE